MEYSEELFNALTTNSPIGIVVLDLDGKVVSCNPAFEKLFGYTFDEIHGQALDPLISTSEDYYQNRNYTQRILKLGETVRISGKRHKKNRSVIDVEIQGIPLVNQGKQTGLLTLYHDVTDLVRAEQNIRDMYSSFAYVMDSIDASVYVADLETFEIIFMNQHMRDLFKGDHVGKPCYQVFRDEKGQCPVCTNNRLLDLRGNPVGEVVWEGQNPITGRWYQNFDRAISWSDGRYVRLEVSTDITEMKEVEQKLTFLATSDNLTLLPNRTYLMQRLNELYKQEPSDRHFAVLFLDIDNFKEVNDNYGHLVGDQTLIAASGRMKSCLRDDDLIARVSGDEFIIILNGSIEPEWISEIAQRIISAVARPYEIDQNNITISISIGISTPEYGKSVDQIVQQSDEAMYMVKRSGKNGFRYFHSDPE